MAVELNKSFFERCVRQHAETMYGEMGYNPGAVLGDYSQEAVCPGIGEYGMLEPYLERTIEHWLETRDEGDGRVAAMDAGGGLSVTWLRLAKRFKTAIKEDRLLLATSSLHANPRTVLAAAIDAAERGKRDAPTITETEEARQLLGRYGEMVLYVAAHPAARGVVHLKDLWTAFDVIHERRGPSGWSMIPETHVLRTAGSLAATGQYLLHQSDIGYAYGSLERPVTDAERKVRIGAMFEATRTVLQPQPFGLRMTSVVEAGEAAGMPLDYFVLSGPDAGPFTL